MLSRSCTSGRKTLTRMAQNRPFWSIWAAARTLQAVFGVTYEIYSEARQLFLGAISKIGSGVDFRVCRDCVTRFSGFLLPGLTNDDEPIKWYFAVFLANWKVLSAALMKNGL